MGLILTEGFRTNSEMLAGVERLAVMVPDSAFLESPADEPVEFPGLSPALILWTLQNEAESERIILHNWLLSS